MKDANDKFWPYKPKISIIWAIILLTILLLTVAILRSITGWPSDSSMNTVLIGILLLSFLPVFFAILDVISSKGGSIGYKDFKIDFGKVQRLNKLGFKVPGNIGAPAKALYDNDSEQILETLQEATQSDIAVINLKKGEAWWETRLLVLLAGAERLQIPDIIVFLGTDAKKEQSFQGWAHPKDLLPEVLGVNPLYRFLLEETRAIARQWELVAPVNNGLPAQPGWINGLVAGSHSNWAFNEKGLPNKLFAERLLQNALGLRVETHADMVKKITLSRLDELFRPVLNKNYVDLSWPNDRQMEALLMDDAPFVAITDDNKYISLISRSSITNESIKKYFHQSE